MASALYFCNSCANKRVRDVKTELEQLFKKKETDPLICGICCSKLQVKKEPDEDRSGGNQQELLETVGVIKRETTADDVIVNIDIDRPESREDDDESPDYYEDVLDALEEESDTGTNYSDEIESKGTKSKAPKKERKINQKKNLRNKLEITDLNPEIKDMILEGSLTSKEFACKMCEKEFKLNAAMLKKFSVHLGEHIKEQQEVPLKPYKCSMCTSIFSCFFSLKSHTKGHTNPVFYECTHPECGRRFKLKQSVRKHEELVHSNVAKERKEYKKLKRHKCQICGAVLEYGSSFKKHMLRHEGFKPFKCSECGKCFIDKPNLTRHQERHQDSKKSVCEICGKTFVLPNELKTHRITHTDERIYQCEFCPYRAKRLGTLRAHIRNIHTESDPNKCKCNFCGLTFLSATACTKHEKKHKSGLELAEALVKPYQCAECGYRATKPCHIRIHRRSHTGEKLFKCVHCERAFTQNGQCTRHMKICKKR